MIYTTGTIAINGNTVTGTGTDFSAPLSLIRVGCTLIAVSDPIQIFTITEIKSSTELSVTPSANPAIPAGTKFSILLSDSISVDGLAQDVAETLRYYQSKETEVAEALEWSQDHIADKIGLSDNYRDCPNISGDPSNYVGFTRILELATGFPSVASGEWCLTGWIAQTNDDSSGVKTYSGVFVGYNTKSLYSYSYGTNSGVSWTRHTKKDDVDRLQQTAQETALWAASKKHKFVLWDSGTGENIDWGVYNNVSGTFSPLGVHAGGTGARDAETAKKNLRIPYTGMANPVEFGAPAGAEPNKYYPVIFQFPGWIGTEILAEITVSTASKLGADYPNNNSVHLWFRNRGWSDCGTVAFGHYRAWDSNEVAINCVRTSAKNFQNYAAVYVMGSAFPVKLSATVGTEVIIPTSDFTPAPSSDAPTFKWGISNANEGLGLDEVGIIGNTLNFSSGLSGFYCSDIFRTFDGIPYASTGYNNQKWTGLQDFTTTRINSSDFSRRLKFEAAETAKSNATLSLWGSDSRPSVLEYNLSNPDTEEGIGFGYYCQLNTDNSILFCVNGAVNCVTLSQSSDRDLKDNIQVIGDATEAIRKMNGYTYTLKENGLPYAGVIAQEVMEALPEAVGSFTHYGKELQGPTVDGNELREETRYLNVDYAAVTGLLVQVARETDNRVTELEEENASLRANIAEMDERIAKLEELVSKLTGSEK